MNLKLKEIIWEIIAKCDNNCTYCGSKSRTKKVIDEKLVINVAKEIAKYPPEFINISGGDPMLLSYDVHKTVIDLLMNVNTVCKIIVNPKSIKDSKILSLYDWIGLSINNKEELKLFEKNCSHAVKIKSTVITNFNMNNIFLFDKIANSLKKNKIKTWQIQFTMDKKKVESLLYKDTEALAHLQDKVNSVKGIDIIPADNMNDGDCSAGINSCGIDCDGNLMPCLSMFSWCNDKDKLFIDNILKNNLKEIWENKFKECRFKKFKCCKDICGRKTITINSKVPSKVIPIKDKKFNDIFPTPKTPKRFPDSNRVMAYAVSPYRDTPMLYGVSPNGGLTRGPSIVALYGIFQTKKKAKKLK